MRRCESDSPRKNHAPLLLLVQIVFLFIHPSLAAVYFPGNEFNAATGQIAHASSYYEYSPNPVRDNVYVPQNAIDGFSDESSWWSSGDEDPLSHNIFWQLNLTSATPALKRIVIRWHGFLTPASYKIRVSYMGENFQTIAAVVNETIAYDRVDTITTGLEKLNTRFQFLRIVIEAPNVCQDIYGCAVDGSTAAIGKTNERIVFGIREFELWAVGTKSGVARTSEGAWILMVTLSAVVTIAVL